MSRPWLSDRQHSSKSKSPMSDKPRSRVDQYGQSSASERGDQRNFHREHARSGARDRHQRHKHNSSSSSSSGSDDSISSNHSRIIASSKPKYLNARLFVANIISKDVTRDELTKHFEKYGNIVDVLVHAKNYAFIQFSKPEQALLAVEGEHGSTLKGWRLDVKMASENRKTGGFGGRGGRGDDRGGRGDDRGGRGDDRGGRGEDRGGRGGRGGGRFGSSDRDRSPLREDRLRDPYMDPFRGGGPRPPFPPGGEYGLRDPFFPEPFIQGYPEPWLADDPYRRDPYADPYRDPFRHRAPPPPVIECEIFVLNAQMRAYGDAVERRVKEHNIITAVSVMPEGRTAQQLVEELTAQSALFAIFINPQNEMHRSLTLNILHGTPQEHRNMPLDDALALVGRSFLKYVDGLREKAQAAATPLPSSAASRVFLPPSSEVSYLLNLLADNRALTVPELNTIIKYLVERRDKLIDAESRPAFSDADGFGKTPPLQRLDHSQSPCQEPCAPNSTDAASSNVELTSKILSLFTSAGGSIQGVPPANGTQQQATQPKLPSGTPAPPPPPPQGTIASNASLINFDNPNVQKALDNLIQSTPSLLKNINTNVSLPTPQMGTPSVYSNMGAMNSGMYGPSPGVMSGHTQGHMNNNLNQTILPSGYGGVQGPLMPGLGSQGVQGPPGPSPQDIFNMSARAMQGLTGPSAQDIYNMSVQAMQALTGKDCRPTSQPRY